MGTELVLETSEHFNILTRLLARENFIEMRITVEEESLVESFCFRMTIYIDSVFESNVFIYCYSFNVMN
jgi:hypothetical protein